MHEPLSLVTVLLKSIFVGFGFTIPVISLIKTSNLKAVEFKQLFILCAVQTLRIAGILYFLLTAVEGYMQYTEMNSLGNEQFTLSFPANFWIYFFYSAILYLLISQMFWIKKLYHKKPALIMLSLLLLILPSQWLLSIHTKPGTDFWSGIKLNLANLGIEFVLNQVVFIFIVITIILTTGKFKTKKN